MATAFGKAIRVLFVSLIYVLVYQLMQILTQVASGLTGIYRALPVTRYNIQSVFSDSLMSNLFLCLIASMFLSLGIYWAFGLLRERRPQSELGFRRLTEGTAIGAIMLACGCRLAVSVYSSVAENVPVLEDSLENRADLTSALMTPINIALALLSFMILGPIFEEILFRGFVQTELMRGFPPTAAIVIGALIFAGAHGSLFQSAFTFFVGLALGWSYHVTRNLFVTSIIHIVFNTSAMLTVQYKLSGFVWLTLASLLAVILTAAGAILVYRNRKAA